MSRPHRSKLLEALGLRHAFAASEPAPPGVELPRQVHGARVAVLPPRGVAGEADAVVSDVPGRGVGVRTADCVPILLASPDGRAVAAVHAGWRGTAAGIAREAVRVLARRAGCAPGDLVAALGPHIGPCCYEVDRRVRERFAREEVFLPGVRPGRWMLDLGTANELDLLEAGMRGERIERVGGCTRCSPEGYPSYRRGDRERRMVHWIFPAARPAGGAGGGAAAGGEAVGPASGGAARSR